MKLEYISDEQLQKIKDYVEKNTMSDRVCTPDPLNVYRDAERLILESSIQNCNSLIAYVYLRDLGSSWVVLGKEIPAELELPEQLAASLISTPPCLTVEAYLDLVQDLTYNRLGDAYIHYASLYHVPEEDYRDVIEGSLSFDSKVIPKDFKYRYYVMGRLREMYVSLSPKDQQELDDSLPEPFYGYIQEIFD